MTAETREDPAPRAAEPAQGPRVNDAERAARAGADTLRASVWTAVRRYVTERRQYRTAARTPANLAAFDSLLTACATEVAGQLAGPWRAITPELWEALGELCTSYGAHLRMRERG